MQVTQNPYLIVAGMLSGVAALVHLGCIVFGASWFRYLGAGERMARMAATGHWYPTVAALIIASVLIIWALYAFSGAGLIPRLPFLRWVLCAITAVYLLRGLAFFVIVPYFPGNSLTFWVASSSICFAIGLIHLVGVKVAWQQL